MGVDMGGGEIEVAYVGQADDVALMSASIRNLGLLVGPTERCCGECRVSHVPEGAGLLAFSNTNSLKLYCDRPTSNMVFGSKDIPSTTETERVGALRSVDGCLPNHLAGLSTHRGMSLLPVGLAWGRRGGPAAVLRVGRTLQMWGGSAAAGPRLAVVGAVPFPLL